MASSPSTPNAANRKVHIGAFWDSLRHHPRTCGVYAIINRDNLKIYIGSTRRMNWRLNGHICELFSGEHSNKHLLRSFRKNPSAFEFVLIEQVFDLHNLLKREQFWINFYESTNPQKGYNLCKSARSCGDVEKYKDDISLSVKRIKPPRKPVSEAHRNRLREIFKGKRPCKKAQENLIKAISVPVIQLDKQGNSIRQFPSVAEAARSIGGCSPNIHRVLKRVRGNVSYLGFGWKYA